MATKKDTGPVNDSAPDEVMTGALNHEDPSMQKDTQAGDASPPSKKRTTGHDAILPLTHVLLPRGVLTLSPGHLLVICAKPGFRRAGIEHERLKLWERNALTTEQIAQMRREPLLTLIEVS